MYDTKLTNQDKAPNEIAVFNAYTNFTEKGIRTTNYNFLRSRAKQINDKKPERI